jgi:hypothetical protein
LPLGSQSMRICLTTLVNWLNTVAPGRITTGCVLALDATNASTESTVLFITVLKMQLRNCVLSLADLSLTCYVSHRRHPIYQTISRPHDQTSKLELRPTYSRHSEFVPV